MKQFRHVTTVTPSTDVIDADGFRPNVGIIVANSGDLVLWAKRRGQDAWQFPQGGIQRGESPEAALFRELQEEVGLTEGQVTVLGCTRDWLRYRLPSRYVRRGQKPVCIGQKQKWFVLRLRDDASVVRLDGDFARPEFDAWRWVPYWHPLDVVIPFKRAVYRQALTELAPLIGLVPPGPGDRSASPVRLDLH
jgi:putative (di)nucleoside polyphosphate hydrolase